jgi:hypothetical protein
MKKKDDPATIFEQRSYIKNQYNTKDRKIHEADLIAVVIDAAPVEYQGVLTTEQLRLGATLKLPAISLKTQKYDYVKFHVVNRLTIYRNYM